MYGQKFDVDANPVGNEFVADTSVDGNYDVVTLKNGGFVISWDNDESSWSEHTDESGRGVFGQVYDADGNKVGRTELVFEDSINDSLLETGSTLTVTDFEVVTSQGGEVDINPDGTFTYTPAETIDSTVEDSFTYTLSNGDTKTAYITPKVSNSILGTETEDNLTGTKNADIIFAGAENDVLKGGLGDDFLSGQTGDDILFGGAGADRFAFTDGLDIVKDFQDGADLLDLRALNQLDSFVASNDIVAGANGTLIELTSTTDPSLDGEFSIFLENIDATQIDITDFAFA